MCSCVAPGHTCNLVSLQFNLVSDVFIILKASYLWWVWWCVHTECIKLVCPAVKHTLKISFTASYGVPNFTEFVSTLAVDELLMGSCNSSIRKVQIKPYWLKKALEYQPERLARYTHWCFETFPNFFKVMVTDLKQQFNQSEGTVYTVWYFTFLLQNCCAT